MSKMTLLVLSAAVAMAQPPGGGMGDGIWQREAVFGEGQTLDSCNAHQPGTGAYHNHASPTCLRLQLGDNIEVARTLRTGSVYREKAGPWKHSPILGWALDGFPVYGPYGYGEARIASSAVRRMKSGFRLRNMTERSSLPQWALTLHPNVPQNLAASQYGPPVNALFPLGRYIEDYEWVEGLGDLDVYNGRFAVTPEYPNGTYAYFVTISETGGPAFPNILNMQYNGTVSGGRAQTVPAGVTEQAAGGESTIALLSSWATKNAGQDAQVISGFNPAAGPKSTWPFDVPEGVRVANAVLTPVKADVQRLRYSDSAVYVNASGLASHVMGPWFDALQGGGNFGGYPIGQNYQVQLPRAPAVAASKANTGLGAIGLWVNGVAIFNPADGSSYSNARGTDVGGGLVSATSLHVSSASQERGPVAPGSLVTAYSLFGSALSTTTEAATTAAWPTALGGTTITIRDAAGAEHSAEISYVSPLQVNYRIPARAANGYATVRIATGGNVVTGNLNINSAYPNLFQANASGLAAGYVTRRSGGRTTTEQIVQLVNSQLTALPIDLGPSGDEVYLVLFGSGMGSNDSASATVGGAAMTLSYAGAQGTYPGLEQFNLLLPRSTAGKGTLDVAITVGGRVSNAVRVEVR